jgi:hypothetical protein
LAEKILLARPCEEVKKRNLNKFYEEQKHYKNMISRLSFYLKKREDKINTKRHRDKWLN